MLDFAGGLNDELRAGTVDLPAWSPVTERVRRALQDENIPAEQLARLVSADASLAIRVLTMANAALMGYSGRPLTDLRTAVIRVGRDKLSSAVYAVALAQLRGAPGLQHKRPELELLWRDSTTVAALSQLIATRVGGVDPDEALLGGLLHNVGQLYILARMDTDSPMWRNQHARDTLLLCWHARIGGSLARSWGLPEPLCAAIVAQDSLALDGRGPPSLGEVLAAATLAAENHDSIEEAASRLAMFNRLGLNADGWTRLLNDAADAASAMRAMLGE